MPLGTGLLPQLAKSSQASSKGPCVQTDDCLRLWSPPAARTGECAVSIGESGRGADAQMGLRGSLPPEIVLGGYELKSILGRGAFGITYRAHQTALHRDVAIKEYLPATLAIRDGRTTVMPLSADHAEQFAWGRER